MRILASIIDLTPQIFWWLVFGTAFWSYFFRKNNYKILAVISVSFYVVYAAFLSIVRYAVWDKTSFGRLLMGSSLDNDSVVPGLFKHGGYFVFYIFGRFWLHILIVIGVAFAFYWFLLFLKKYKERFFEEGETELGFLAALIASWPNFAVFLPLVFLFVVLVSIFRRLVLKKMYTTLGWPFLLAALLVLLWGGRLISLFHLGVLKI